MTADEYQIAAKRTDWPDARAHWAAMILHGSLGLAAEAGEVAALAQKWYGQNATYDETALADELGDVLWFVAKLARACDRSLSSIMEQNIAKLEARYPDGPRTRPGAPDFAPRRLS